MIGKLKAMVKKASISETEGGSTMGPNLRRMSHFSFGRRPSMASRGSISGTSYTKPPGPKVRYENTYRYTPKDGEKFKSSKAKEILKDVVTTYINKNETYDPNMCKKSAPTMCDIIQEKLKDLQFPRYKYVVQVLMGQSSDQCLRSTSRCLWNTNTDDFAEFHYSVNDMFVSATVYAVFLE
ncbi:dynein light chain Tctex-type 5-like [Mytilus trossulus]|uniref:dynein light chain Tctex-type 5-like n=1 Tax=Mytilus trossulus TaxID=6551 RepID=UPI003003AD83